MWPWEHLAFGYLLYSAYRRARHGEPPTDRATFVLAFATQLPDLVDKPLGWVLDVFPGGLALGHSLLFWLPLSVAALAVGRWRGEAGDALAVGGLSHLAGDVLYPVLLTGTPYGAFLLWPLLGAGAEAPVETLPKVRRLFEQYVSNLSLLGGYALFEVLLLGGTLALWDRDGRPGLRDARAALDRWRRSDVDR